MKHRTLAILKAIIEEYISSAEPVGSKTVVNKYDFGVSSATIRNEMALLEEMGFIESPHTSAGRVPLEKAYRLYVDTIVEESLSDFKDEFLKSSSVLEHDSFRKFIESVSKEVSSYTHYASIAMIASEGRDSVDLIQIIKIAEKEVLCVVLMESKKTISFITDTQEEIPKNKWDDISKKLTDKLKGVKSFDIEDMDIEINEYKNDVEKTVKEIAKQITEHCDVDVIVEGASNLFELPEFYDHDRAKKIMKIFSQRQILCNMFRKNGKNEINIKIGSENEIIEFKNMTTVYRTFDFNTRGMISFGVAGPLRMNYSKVLASMRDVDKLMHGMFRML